MTPIGNQDSQNPWPGLAPFTEEESRLFHGRDEEIRTLLRLIERKPLTVLFGQSGLGKSSLLQAGVFPQLRATGYCPSYIRLDHSEGAPPPAEQVKAFVRDASARAGTWTKPGVAQPGESLWEFFHHRDDRLIASESSMGILPMGSPLRSTGVPPVDLPPASDNPTGKMPVPLPDARTIIPVLVIDQFEELFTLGAGVGAQRDRAVAFMTALAELVENRVPDPVVARLEQSPDDLEAFDFSRTDYRVCLSLREDFLPQLETLAEIMPALMENRMRLTRMTGTQALAAVLKPGAGLVDDAVARTIVEFVSGARGGSAERLAELTVEPPLLSVICHELNERRRTLGHAQITADLVTGNRREILNDFYERSVADLPAGMRTFVEDKLLTKSGFRDNLALETALEEPGVTQPLIDTLVSRRLLRLEDRIGVQRVELTHDVLADVVRNARDGRQQRLALEQAQARERLALAAVVRQTRRQRFMIAGLTLAVIALSIGAVFGLRAQRRAAALAGEAELATGSRLLDEGNTGDGLAYLAAAARRDQGNSVAATRIVSTLAARNFLLPVGSSLTLPSPATQALFLADGRSALVLGEDSRVRVIDLAEWKVAREYSFGQKIQPQGIRVAAKNPAVFAVALADGTVQVCDTTTGQPRGKAITPPNLVETSQNPSFQLGTWRTYFAFSPDGRWLMTFRGTTAVFDTTTGEERFHGEHFNGVMPTDFATYNPFSPDSSHIAIAIREFVSAGSETKTVKSSSVLLSVPDGTVVATRLFEDPYHADGAKNFSADGTRVLMLSHTGAGATKDDTSRTPAATVCDARTLQPIGPAIPFSSGQVRPSSEIVLTPDGNRVVMNLSGDRAARVYDVKTGQLAFPELPHGASFTGSGISEDSAIYATNSIEGQIRLWDLRTGALFAESTLKLDRGGTAALSRDGRSLLVFSATGSAYRLEVSHGPASPLALPRPNSSPNVSLAEKAPARILYFSNTAATMLDIASGRSVEGGFALPQRIFAVHRHPNDLTVRSGDRWIARTAAGGRTLWSWGESGPPRETPFAETFPSAAFPAPLLSANGHIAAIANPVGPSGSARRSLPSINLWDLRVGKKVTEITGGEVTLSLGPTTDFSPDDQRLVVRESPEDGVLRVYGIRDGELLFQLALEGSAAFLAARFNRDGTRLLTGNAWGTLQIWDGISGKPLRSIQAHRYGLERIDFSPDGRYYATGSADGTAQVRDAATHEPVGAPLAHDATVNRVQFSADNTRVATSTMAGAVRVWDLRTGLPLHDFFKHTGSSSSSLDFSPDGRFLMSFFFNARPRTTHLLSTPPTGPAGRAPAWLLRLATVCAGRRLNESAKLVSALDEFDRFDDLRREIAALPDTAPYATWAKWFLSTDPARSIAPGFTITPAAAAQLAQELAAPPAAPVAPAATPRP